MKQTDQPRSRQTPCRRGGPYVEYLFRAERPRPAVRAGTAGIGRIPGFRRHAGTPRLRPEQALIETPAERREGRSPALQRPPGNGRTPLEAKAVVPISLHSQHSLPVAQSTAKADGVIAPQRGQKARRSRADSNSGTALKPADLAAERKGRNRHPERRRDRRHAQERRGDRPPCQDRQAVRLGWRATVGPPINRPRSDRARDERLLFHSSATTRPCAAHSEGGLGQALLRIAVRFKPTVRANFSSHSSVIFSMGNWGAA